MKFQGSDGFSRNALKIALGHLKNPLTAVRLSKDFFCIKSKVI